jgi:hypothetical protein
MIKLTTLFLFSLVSSLTFAVPTKTTLKPITLEGDSGGLVDQSPWQSQSMLGKVRALFYVDPDFRNANENLKTALTKENYPLDKYGSVAITNLAASWLPNAVIKSSLEANQKKYPNTVYVMDKNKLLVKEWGLDDDAFNLMVLDQKGVVLWNKSGEHSDSDVAEVTKLIRSHL